MGRSYTLAQVQNVISNLKVDGQEKDMPVVLGMLRAYAATLRQQAGRVDEGMERLPTDATLDSLATVDAARAVARVLRDELRAALAQNTQRDGEPVLFEAVGVVQRDMTGELDVNWNLEGGIHAVGEGSVLLCADREIVDSEGCASLYLHAERARVPAEVAAWVEAKREHKRLVGVYNDRLAYAKQHDLGRVSVDHEYQAMCAQQRVMDALVEPMFNALAAAPSQRAEVK